jgi:hypothetical protein
VTALAKPALGLTRDQWHRYVAHYPPAPPTGPLVGVTSVLKLQDVLIGGDLASWGGRIAAEYLLTQFIPINHDEHEDAELITRSLGAVSAKRDIGTEAHAQIEKILLGQPVAPTERTAPYVYAFSSFMAAHRPEFLLTEAMVCNLAAGYAGTFDFAARENGKVGLYDIKTGRSRPSHRIQLALYGGAEFVGVEGSTRRKRIPKFDAYFALYLTPDGYELVEHEVTPADLEHGLFLVEAYHRIRAWEKEGA